VESQTVLSVREVLNEVVDFKGSDRLSGWVKVNRQCFQTATAEELQFVAQIFAVPHFRSMVRTQERLQGKPVADPFVIAKAKVLAGCVVTEENYKPNSSKIPNVCEHFGIECLDLEGFMERENWLF
jgi:Tfp pilus assembly protein PilP